MWYADIRSQAEVLCCVILLLLCSFAIWQLLCHHCGRCFHHRNYFHSCNYFLNDNYFHHGNCFTMTTTFLIPSRLQLCLRSPVWQSWLVVSITFVLSGCALQQMSKHCVKPWHCLQAHCSQLTQKPSWGSSHLSLWLHRQLIWPKQIFIWCTACVHTYLRTHIPTHTHTYAHTYTHLFNMLPSSVMHICLYNTRRLSRPE